MFLPSYLILGPDVAWPRSVIYGHGRPESPNVLTKKNATPIAQHPVCESSSTRMIGTLQGPVVASGLWCRTRLYHACQKICNPATDVHPIGIDPSLSHVAEVQDKHAYVGAFYLLSTNIKSPSLSSWCLVLKAPRCAASSFPRSPSHPVT